MKRTLILSLAVLLAGAVKAQSVSVKAGLNYSNIIRTGDENFETEFKPGFHAGLGIDVPLIDRLALAPEVLFSQKGYKVTGGGLLGDAETTITTNFIDIPILAKINAATGFNIHLGPQISFLTSTTTSFKQGTQEYRDKVKEDNTNLKKNLIGGVVGAGFDLSPKLNLHARYGIDFKKNNENGTSETPEYKNQVIQLGLGIKL